MIVILFSSLSLSYSVAHCCHLVNDFKFNAKFNAMLLSFAEECEFCKLCSKFM